MKNLEWKVDGYCCTGSCWSINVNYSSILFSSSICEELYQVFEWKAEKKIVFREHIIWEMNEGLVLCECIVQCFSSY
ncbi:Protein of unknown function [Gryllus bimaculatus]|nr:Protein of unknown function [Gryllus bimaculatus]